MNGTVMLDGSTRLADLLDDDEYTITVSFPAEEGISAPGVSGWCNSVGIRIREEHGIQVWISVADPRGGLQMEVRPGENGDLLLSVPSEKDGLPHGDGLEKLNDHGFYRILGASVPDDEEDADDDD